MNSFVSHPSPAIVSWAGLLLLAVLAMMLGCQAKSVSNPVAGEVAIGLRQQETPSATSRETAVETLGATPRETQATVPQLQVVISGAKSKQGNFVCAIFANESDFQAREHAIITTRLPAQDTEVTWNIPSLDANSYAIAIYHDENENDKLDRHALGFPTERYGFSNNVRGKLGPPKFSAAQFEVDQQPVSMKIQLK